MSLTLAETSEPLARVWEMSALDLATARSSDKDCFYALGHVLEWKQWNAAADLKDALVQLSEEFRGGGLFLANLRKLYRKAESAENVDDDRLMARAARFQRRFARITGKREREFQKLRAHLVRQVAGRKSRGKLRLRPEGLAALDWAGLAGE